MVDIEIYELVAKQLDELIEEKVIRSWEWLDGR